MVTSKQYYREDMIVPCHPYQPEVELLDNEDGLEFRTLFTNVVSTDLILYNVKD